MMEEIEQHGLDTNRISLLNEDFTSISALNKAGVETRLITGHSGEGDGPDNHMWNAVKLDGEWYNLDITWDDLGQGGKNYDYFLKSDSSFTEHTRTGDYDVNGTPLIFAEKSYKHPFSFSGFFFFLSFYNIYSSCD